MNTLSKLARENQRPVSGQLVSPINMTFDFELPPSPTVASSTLLPPSPFLQDTFSALDQANSDRRSEQYTDTGRREEHGPGHGKSKSLAGTPSTLELPPVPAPRIPQRTTSYTSLEIIGNIDGSHSPSPLMESSLFPSIPPKSPLPSLPSPIVMNRQFIDSRDKPYSPQPARPVTLQANHSYPGLLSPSWAEVPPPPSPKVPGPRLSPRPSMKSLKSGLSIKKKRSTTHLPSPEPMASPSALTIGTPYQENAATFPLPQHVMTRPKTSGAATTVAGVTVPTHHTTAQPLSRPPLKSTKSTKKSDSKPEQKNEPKLEKKKDDSKRKTRLLNPMNLLQRRRSEYPDTAIDERVQREALARQRDVVASGVNKPLPDFDPRIKGNMVHDFSAPRVKRSTFDEMDMPAEYLTGSTSLERTPVSAQFPPRTESLVNRRPVRDSAEKKASPHTPVFLEHLEEQPSASRRISSIQAENLENASFLQRVSRQSDGQSPSAESNILPPFARRSQILDPIQASIYQDEGQKRCSSPPTNVKDKRESSSNSSVGEVSPVTTRSSAPIFSPVSPTSTSKTSRPASQFSGTLSSEHVQQLKKTPSQEKHLNGNAKSPTDTTTSRHYSVIPAPPAIETIEEGSVDGSPTEPASTRFSSRQPQFIAKDQSYRTSDGPTTLLDGAPQHPSSANNAATEEEKTSPRSIRQSVSSNDSTPSKKLVEKRASAVGHSTRSSTIPKKQNSNASRFSFQMGEASSSAAQEQALEEKHRKIVGERTSNLPANVKAAAKDLEDEDADDEDYFDEDAMDDMDEMEMQEGMVGGLGLGIRQGLGAMGSSTSSLQHEGEARAAGSGGGGFYLHPQGLNHPALSSPESESESESDPDVDIDTHKSPTTATDKTPRLTSTVSTIVKGSAKDHDDDDDGSDVSSLYDESNIPTITDECDVPYADHPAFRAHSAVYRNSELPSMGMNYLGAEGSYVRNSVVPPSEGYVSEDGGYWRDSTLDGYWRDSVYYAASSHSGQSRAGSMLVPPQGVRASGMSLTVPGLHPPMPGAGAGEASRGSSAATSPVKQVQQRPPLPQRDSGNSERNRAASGLSFGSPSPGVTPREERANVFEGSNLRKVESQDEQQKQQGTSVAMPIASSTHPTASLGQPARPPPPTPAATNAPAASKADEVEQPLSSPQLDPETLAGLERAPAPDEKQDDTPLKRNKSFRVDGRRNGSVGGSRLTSPIVGSFRGATGGPISGDFESFVRNAIPKSPLLASSPPTSPAGPLGLGLGSLFQDFNFSSSSNEVSSANETPTPDRASTLANANNILAPKEDLTPRPIKSNRSTMSNCSGQSDGSASHNTSLLGSNEEDEAAGIVMQSSLAPQSVMPPPFRFPRGSETYSADGERHEDDDDMYFDDGHFGNDSTITLAHPQDESRGGSKGFDENVFDDERWLARPNANHIVHAPRQQLQQQQHQPHGSGDFLSTVSGGSGDFGPYPTFALPSHGLSQGAAAQAKRESQMLLEDLIMAQQDGYFDPKLIPQRNPSEDAKRGSGGGKMPPPPPGEGGVREREMLQRDLEGYFETLAKAVIRAEREGRFDRPVSMGFAMTGDDEEKEEENAGIEKFPPVRNQSLHKSGFDVGLGGSRMVPPPPIAITSSPPKLGFDFGFDTRPLSLLLGPDNNPPPGSTFPSFPYTTSNEFDSSYPTDDLETPYSFEGSSADADFDDDALIAAANAEILASDDEGFYGQEFHFYGRPRANSKEGEVENIHGGYFGADGDDGLARQKSVKEPNLTPITERSEFSTRSSFVGLLPGMRSSAGMGVENGGGGGGGFFGPASPLLSRMPVTPLMESEISGEELRRLRAMAFKRVGSRSLKSEGGNSNRSSAQSLVEGGGMQPQQQGQQHVPVFHNQGYHHGHGGHSQGTSGSESDSSPSLFFPAYANAGGLPTGTPGQNPPPPAVLGLPFQESPSSSTSTFTMAPYPQQQHQRRALFDPYANNSTGQPAVVDFDLTPRKAATPSTWLDPGTVRKILPRDISSSSTGNGYSAGGGAGGGMMALSSGSSSPPKVSSPLAKAVAQEDWASSPNPAEGGEGGGGGGGGFAFGFPQSPNSTHPDTAITQQQQHQAASSPRNRTTHARKPSDSVTYVREDDPEGGVDENGKGKKQRWVLERRRTSEAGEVELVGRELVRGGWI